MTTLAEMIKPEAVHISLDLETAGLGPTAAILQLGAVKIGTNEVYESTISVHSNESVGLSFEKETMEWWDKQDPELRKRVFQGTSHLFTVLDEFAEWAGPDAYLWTNGADFDLPILKTAYETYRTYPFDFRKHRCYRTLRSLLSIGEEVQMKAGAELAYPNLQKHNALHDALYQSYFISRKLARERTWLGNSVPPQ